MSAWYTREYIDVEMFFKTGVFNGQETTEIVQEFIQESGEPHICSQGEAEANICLQASALRLSNSPNFIEELRYVEDSLDLYCLGKICPLMIAKYIDHNNRVHGLQTETQIVQLQKMLKSREYLPRARRPKRRKLLSTCALYDIDTTTYEVRLELQKIEKFHAIVEKAKANNDKVLVEMLTKKKATHEKQYLLGREFGTVLEYVEIEREYYEELEKGCMVSLTDSAPHLLVDGTPSDHDFPPLIRPIPLSYVVENMDCTSPNENNNLA